MSKVNSKKLHRVFIDSAHKVWLAGLGALLITEEEGSRLFSTLVEKGREFEVKSKDQASGKTKVVFKGMKSVATGYWESFDQILEEKLSSIVTSMGVPTKIELGHVTNKVEELTKMVEKLLGRHECHGKENEKIKQSKNKF